jgi:hypothetical protein
MKAPLYSLGTNPRLLAVLCALMVCFLFARPVSACSVPVFRYALDRWEADAYPLIVFHDGPLSEEQRRLVERLQKPGAANLQVTALDVARPLDKTTAALWQKHRTEKLPALLLKYPDSAAIPEPAWTAPLEAASVDALLDSPVRREVASRILKGESGVWVLLECGKPDKDEKAARFLIEQLERMPKVLKLPDPDDPVADEILAAKNRPPVRIAFSLLRLSRNDPAERAFASMLLHTEDDLTTYDEPMVFPIFGRGRALEARIGKGINEENITDACAFVIGACSCEVKRINPGKDLLMSVDWDRSTGVPPAREKATDKTSRGKRAKKKQPALAAGTPARTVLEEIPAEDLAPLESASPALRYLLYGLGTLATLLFLCVWLRYRS